MKFQSRKKNLVPPRDILNLINGSIEEHVKNFDSPVSVFNNQTKRFSYCNKKFLELTGLTQEEFENFEFQNFLDWIHPKDHALLSKEIGLRLRHLHSIPSPLLSQQFNFRFNFRLKAKNKDSHHTCILAQCSVIEWGENNIPLHILTILSDITNYNRNNKIVFSINRYDTGLKHWVNVYEEEFKHKPHMLTKRETELLVHIINDKSAVEISKELNIAFNTVRAHWRNILHKTQCSNQKELKKLAIREGWI